MRTRPSFLIGIRRLHVEQRADLVRLIVVLLELLTPVENVEEWLEPIIQPRIHNGHITMVLIN